MNETTEHKIKREILLLSSRKNDEKKGIKEVKGNNSKGKRHKSSSGIHITSKKQYKSGLVHILDGHQFG